MMTVIIIIAVRSTAPDVVVPIMVSISNEWAGEVEAGMVAKAVAIFESMKASSIWNNNDNNQKCNTI